MKKTFMVIALLLFTALATAGVANLHLDVTLKMGPLSSSNSNALLLETGDYLLLETGDKLLLE